PVQILLKRTFKQVSFPVFEHFWNPDSDHTYPWAKSSLPLFIGRFGFRIRKRVLSLQDMDQNPIFLLVLINQILNPVLQFIAGLIRSKKQFFTFLQIQKYLNTVTWKCKVVSQYTSPINEDRDISRFLGRDRKPRPI